MPRANIGEAWIALNSKITKFMSGIDKADKRMRTMSQNVTHYAKSFAKFGAMAGAAMAAVGTAVAVKGVKSTMAYALELHKLSKQTGMTVGDIHRLRYAVEQEHGDFASISKVIPILAKYMEYARQGMKTYSREFDAMGVAVTDSEGKLRDVYDVLLDMSDYFASKGISGTEKQAHAMALLGRRGAEMIPVLSKGREYFQLMGDEVERLSPGMGKLADMAKKWDDALTKLKYGMMGVWGVLAKALIPKLKEWAEKLGKWMESGKAQEWAQSVVGALSMIAEKVEEIGASPVFRALSGWAGLAVKEVKVGTEAYQKFWEEFETWGKAQAKRKPQTRYVPHMGVVGRPPVTEEEWKTPEMLSAFKETGEGARLWQLAIDSSRKPIEDLGKAGEKQDSVADKFKTAFQWGVNAANSLFGAAQAVGKAFQKAESIAEKLTRPIREAVLPSLRMRPGEAPGDFRARRQAERTAYRESMRERREGVIAQARLQMAGITPARPMFPGTAGVPALATVEPANLKLRAWAANLLHPEQAPWVKQVIAAVERKELSTENAMTMLANELMGFSRRMDAMQDDFKNR